MLAVLPDGSTVRATDFRFVPRVPAAVLAMHTVLRVLADETQAADQSLVQAVLDYWEVADRETLWRLGSHGFLANPADYVGRMGGMAPLVTAAAVQGSPLARAICDRTVDEIWLGIHLVGRCCHASQVPRILHGSVIQSSYFSAAMARTNTLPMNQRYVIQPIPVTPVVAAVLLAVEQADISLDHDDLVRLTEAMLTSTGNSSPP
ncbi:MAG: hypothetical protein H0X37_08345 [Herpetosiphonaceae bacterium]|nr:hypothetical protein [Herpetosiphonaceae bacterium]